MADENTLLLETSKGKVTIALRPDLAPGHVARIKELTEDAKVAIRNVRRDGNKAADQEEKDKLLSEDDCKSLKEQIQELTKQYENTASDMAKARETEVMDN